MNFNFFNFTSKTFWLGAAMVVAGIVEAIGIPALTAISDTVFPGMESGPLITGGLALIFVRDAIAKS